MLGDRDLMTDNKRIRVFLHLSTGGALALVSILADYMSWSVAGWGLMQTLCLATGLVTILTGFVLPTGVVSRVSTNICLSILSVIIILVLSESAFRLIGFDFANEKHAFQKLPIYYRFPTVPTGQVFFRRSGPEQWTGQVLNTMVGKSAIEPNPYASEPIITVTYNKVGFRNPTELSNWVVVVAGDSFTEQGYLPYEQLFTTLLGNMLNMTVLNLGTSYTGPLTHLSYLQDYGVSTNTRHAVVVFFEGNDLDDLDREYTSLVRWQETGQREYREFKKQPSVFIAFRRLLNPLALPDRPNDPRHAYFKSANGDVAVTLLYAPPDSAEISNETTSAFNYFCKQYALFGKQRNITIWLAYMPCKERVLHGQMRFSDKASEKFKNWQPNDLPKMIAKLSEQSGIRFIDLTPALVEETKSKKELLYNALYDSHLNSLGSQVVAREIARHLATKLPGPSNNALLPR